MFSSRSNELGNQFKNSIIKFADPSYFGRSLLESSNKLMLKDWNYKTHNTDLLNLNENKFVYKKKYQ